MKSFQDHTLRQYLDELSKKVPAPGGGSACALSAALGAALISMSVHYSFKKDQPAAVQKKLRKILTQSEKLRERLLVLVDLDAKAYLKVVQTRHASPKVKAAALKGAREVPGEVCRRCYEAVGLTPYLVEQGNQYLISDVAAAVELLLASFRAAMVMAVVPQKKKLRKQPSILATAREEMKNGRDGEINQ